MNHSTEISSVPDLVEDEHTLKQSHTAEMIDAGVITVAVSGEFDTVRVAALHDLLWALPSEGGPVVIDLGQARCRSGELLGLVCRFRAARQRAGQTCRLAGLHPGIADLEQASLEEVFAVYHDLAHPYLSPPGSTTTPQPAPAQAQAQAPETLAAGREDR